VDDNGVSVVICALPCIKLIGCWAMWHICMSWVQQTHGRSPAMHARLHGDGLCGLCCSADTPFALRWLAAELPAWQGDPAAAIAAHCRLLDDCVRLQPAAAPPDDIDLSGARLWHPVKGGYLFGPVAAVTLSSGSNMVRLLR
jgi:hypothetical protein